MHDPTQSLTELESHDWGEPKLRSSLTETLHRLRHKPIGEFTTEDLRIAIGQRVGLEYLVPLAVEHLDDNPLAAGDLYDGDLLSSAMSVEASYWEDHPELRVRLSHIVGRAVELTDWEPLRAKCKGFLDEVGNK